MTLGEPFYVSVSSIRDCAATYICIREVENEGGTCSPVEEDNLETVWDMDHYEVASEHHSEEKDGRQIAFSK